LNTCCKSDPPRLRSAWFRTLFPIPYGGPVVTLLGAVVALAAAPPMAQEIDCSTTMNQLELNDCEHDLYERADARLNEAYAEAIAVTRARDAQTGSDYEEALREAQRAWVAYRDRHCDLVAENWGGGQAQPMIHAGCLTSETDLRTETLRAYVIRHQQRPYGE
jgi:uncharacterized protein YecT (DUF1311 family)